MTGATRAGPEDGDREHREDQAGEGEEDVERRARRRGRTAPPPGRAIASTVPRIVAMMMMRAGPGRLRRAP